MVAKFTFSGQWEYRSWNRGLKATPCAPRGPFTVTESPAIPSTMSLPRQPLAVVFDMDGLIFDTESLYRDAVVAVARTDGHDIPLALIHSTIGLAAGANRAIYTGHLGPGFDYDAFWVKVSRRFYELAKTELRLKAGVIEMLDALDEMHLPRAIATSSEPEAARHHLGAHGLLDRFQAIVARGDYARGKPSPDPFLKAAERLGVAPEFCLALEDSYNGVRAASSAGMMTIMVPDLLEATDEMEKLCIRIAHDLHEVRVLTQASVAK